MSAERALLLPMFLHAVWVLGLYAALTVVRAQAVSRGDARKDDFARLDGDPPRAARIARNLNNQFEAPLFAWVAVLLLVQAKSANGTDVAAGWLFLLGRVWHTFVQGTTDDVQLRGRVFALNFVAILWLMVHAAVIVFAGSAFR